MFFFQTLSTLNPVGYLLLPANPSFLRTLTAKLIFALLRRTMCLTHGFIS